MSFALKKPIEQKANWTKSNRQVANATRLNLHETMKCSIKSSMSLWMHLSKQHAAARSTHEVTLYFHLYFEAEAAAAANIWRAIIYYHDICLHSDARRKIERSKESKQINWCELAPRWRITFDERHIIKSTWKHLDTKICTSDVQSEVFNNENYQ